MPAGLPTDPLASAPILNPDSVSTAQAASEPLADSTTNTAATESDIWWWEWVWVSDDTHYSDTGPGSAEEESGEFGERRPDVVREGHLPAALQDWWKEVDADKDSQLSLYEWRTWHGGEASSLPVYNLLDLNNDGFLTVEEFNRATGVGKATGELTDAQSTARTDLLALLNTRPADSPGKPTGTVVWTVEPTPVAQPGTPGTVPPAAGGQQPPQNGGENLNEWHQVFMRRYWQQNFMEMEARHWLQTLESNPDFKNDNPNLVTALQAFLQDVKTFYVEGPGQGVEGRDTAIFQTQGFGYLTNVMTAEQLADAKAQWAELRGQVISAWQDYRNWQHLLGVVEVASILDPTILSSLIEGGIEILEGNWDTGLVIIGVGTIPIAGKYIGRWVKGGRVGGVIAHAEPGIVTPPTIRVTPPPSLNLREVPSPGKPGWDPAFGNQPPLVALPPKPKPKPAGYEQPVPVGSKAEPPAPKPDPAPTGGGGGGGGAGGGVPPTSSGVNSNPTINWTKEPKIAKQMPQRGWDDALVTDTINNPTRTAVTRDTRYLPGGGKLDDPATAYFRSDGSYVVRNDQTGAIIQVSDRNDPNWVVPSDFR